MEVDRPDASHGITSILPFILEPSDKLSKVRNDPIFYCNGQMDSTSEWSLIQGHASIYVQYHNCSNARGQVG